MSKLKIKIPCIVTNYWGMPEIASPILHFGRRSGYPHDRKEAWQRFKALSFQKKREIWPLK